MSPADYARATAAATPPQCSGTSPDCSPSAGCTPGATADQQPLQMRDRDEQARLALRQYACSACHRVPG